MSTNAQVYKIGNTWERKVYAHMSAYLEQLGVREFGTTAAGNQYKHWLKEEDSRLNFVSDEIYDATIKRFASHKAGDLGRIKTNTAASQPYCFNLFIYLKLHPALANALFSKLLAKQLTVKHIEVEFTPNKIRDISGFEQPTADESIGDQDANHGTDSDIAVFYTDAYNKTGVLLIEFKFIEPEFSVCSSYKNKPELKTLCNTSDYYKRIVAGKETDKNNRVLCGYHKYQNWLLTSSSALFDIKKVETSIGCPFRYGANQLWRNLLLSEKVAAARNCDEFAFWVFSPKANDDFLWKQGTEDVEQKFRSILTSCGNDGFKKVYLEYILGLLDDLSNNEDDNIWLSKMKEKYLIE